MKALNPEVNFNFTEANAWQYLFAAQHDIQGQAALAGGDSAFLAKIDAMFNALSRPQVASNRTSQDFGASMPMATNPATT